VLLLAERQAIIQACRELVTGGLVRGTSGNVSLRDTATAFIAITPSGTSYLTMTPEEVAVVNIAGDMIDGTLRPTTEVDLHLGIYRARPDVNAVVHTHSPFATTLAALREPVPAVHYILAKAATTVQVAPYQRYGTPELAAACVSTLGADQGVLLSNHGVVAVGKEMASAMAAAEAIEFTAEIAWRARVIGTPVVLDETEMAGVASAFSTYGRASPA
jgi:L-fuculose-phosphate aldolase